jgi:hypothetical protein
MAGAGGNAFFAHPKGGGLTNSIIQKKHTKTLTAVVPAEAGSIGRNVPAVLKEETVVFVRDRAWVERTALGVVGGKTRSSRWPRMMRAQPCCPVRPPKRSIFCLGKARACSGLIFQKLKSLAAATRAMDVQRL